MSRTVKANDVTGMWEVFDEAECGSLPAQFESESWAREFAAAPDMLAVLELAAPCLDSLLNGQGTATADELGVALMAVGAAIAKATI